MVVQAYICQFLQGTKQKNTYSFNYYSIRLQNYDKKFICTN